MALIPFASAGFPEGFSIKAPTGAPTKALMSTRSKNWFRFAANPSSIVPD
jgi:hypothetical protein